MRPILLNNLFLNDLVLYFQQLSIIYPFKIGYRSKGNLLEYLFLKQLGLHVASGPAAQLLRHAAAAPGKRELWRRALAALPEVENCMFTFELPGSFEWQWNLENDGIAQAQVPIPHVFVVKLFFQDADLCPESRKLWLYITPFLGGVDGPMNLKFEESGGG